MSRRGGFAQVSRAVLFISAAATLSAQTNLLTNGHFMSRSAVQTIQTHDCTDQSSAANWSTVIQGPCAVTDSGVELETDVLLGTAHPPFFTLDAHLIHVRAEPQMTSPIGDPANSGIFQVFATSAPFHARVLASVWVYVVHGQAGLGVGPASAVPIATHNSVMGSWEHLVVLSSGAPPVQFNLFSTSSGGSEFYADDAVACPADTDAALSSCLAAVGFATGGAGNLASLVIVPSTVTGGQGATGILTLSAPAPPGGVIATLLSNSGGASVPDSVTVPAGATTGSFPVTTTPVCPTTTATITAVSGNSVSANLTINAGPTCTSGGGGGGGATGTIIGLTISPSTVTGGQGATGTVTLAAAAPSGGIPVTLSSNTGSAGVPGSVMVQQGQTSATFPVTTTPVSSTTTATITATSANSATATLTINPAGSGGGGGGGGGGTPTGTIVSLTVNPPSVTGGESATGTVMLSAPAPSGGIPVSLSSNNGAATVPTQVLVQQGQTTAMFAVNTTPVSSTTVATITATSANSVSAPLTINPAASAPTCVSSVTFDARSVVGGLTLQGVVGLTAKAGIGGQVVNLSSSSLFASVPASVIVGQGGDSATFTVTTSPVAILTTPIISASVAACATVTGGFNIFP